MSWPAPRGCCSARPPALCFGLSDVAIKWLTQAASGPLLGLLSPWTLTAVVAGVIAFFASAGSLQIEGVEVIAITSVAASLAAIIGGILVFHEPIGSGPLGVGARFVAFCLVIAGAALMPAPMRATPPRASELADGSVSISHLLERTLTGRSRGEPPVGSA
jgi:hypothetical protein